MIKTEKTSVKMGSWNRCFEVSGVTIEANYHNNLMKWPLSAAPFDVVIIPSISKNAIKKT